MFPSDDDFDMNLEEPNPLQEEHEDLQQLQTDIEENDDVSYFSIQKPTHVSNKTTDDIHELRSTLFSEESNDVSYVTRRAPLQNYDEWDDDFRMKYPKLNTLEQMK